MRLQSHEEQLVRVRSHVDQQQVGSDVALSIAFPFSAKRVIAVNLRKRFVGEKQVHNRFQQGIKIIAETSGSDLAIIALEAG